MRRSENGFSKGLKPRSHDLKLFQEQFLDLLSQEWEEEERETYDSLEEAIQRHDEDFAWADSLGIDE